MLRKTAQENKNFCKIYLKIIYIVLLIKEFSLNKIYVIFDLKYFENLRYMT